MTTQHDTGAPTGTDVDPGDRSDAGHGLQGKVVAITGGTGSFGSTMADYLLRTGVGAVHVLSRDEAKQHDMRVAFDDPRLRFFIGDVRDRESIDAAFAGVDHVFHAAALKQVPSCEFFPLQAVKTNVLGSHNVIDAASTAGVTSLVCLSTDKAVHPINAMGQSKALMEKTVQAFARQHGSSGLTVAVTRYGNVMASRGSVIPHFIGQILQGRPLTVTDPRMTRFLMSLTESVDLVEYALTRATSGDLFIRKAPACTTMTLARAVAVLMGRPDHPIEVIGTRHGEKLHETLLSREELVTAIDEGDYFRVPLEAASMRYELYFDEGTPTPVASDYTSENTTQLDVPQTVALLRTLDLPGVPPATDGSAGA